MKPLPTGDELWRTWVEFLTSFGAVSADPRVGASVSCEGRVSLVRLSKDELWRYVRDFVEWRREHGLSDGLVVGLPLPLTDSLGECIGPQQAGYAEFVLDGLDLAPVPGFPSPEIVVPPGFQGTWVLSTDTPAPQAHGGARGAEGESPVLTPWEGRADGGACRG